MADISTELNTIENNAYGEVVLSAISSALTDVNPGVDIASELYTITNGRYGSDIRMAIHDALYKISQSGGSGGGIADIDIPHPNPKGPVEGLVAGEFEIVPPIITGQTMGCHEDYFKSGVTSWTINERVFQTDTAEEKVGLVAWFLYGGQYYTSGLLLSPSATAVTYTYNAAPAGSIVKDGATWYYSDTDYAWQGTYTDSTGTLTFYPDILTYPLVPEEMAAVLTAVRAFVVTN